LNNGDNLRTLRFDVYDWNRSGASDLIGSCDLTLDGLLQTSPTQFPLINQQKKLKKGSKYENSGVLRFDAVRYERTASMLDFIRGGHQISLTVAIDFTGMSFIIYIYNY
jgi:Ca2+-dependent lipid-binding protein